MIKAVLVGSVKHDESATATQSQTLTCLRDLSLIAAVRLVVSSTVHRSVTKGLRLLCTQNVFLKCRGMAKSKF